jgi:FHA domain-containing protein
MIQCPNCKVTHPLNTFYCNECGEYLGGESRDTEAFPFMSPDLDAVHRADESDSATLEPSACSLSVLTLLIGQSGHRVSLPLKDAIFLGRMDAANNNYPEVDFGEYGGLEQGVSRRHARIACRDHEIIIEDLGSVNGSFLNGKQLTPYLSHPLHNGDVLQLGKVSIKVIL